MYSRFTGYMTKNGMASLLQKKGAVLVAYSGGADSTLLLHLLQRYCREHQHRLYAVHIHHGIRGAEADRDACHCRDTAEKLGIPLYLKKRDVPALAKEKAMGLEECARMVRYACFDEVCQELGMPDMPVATAHNADDQIETVLFHMLRGSGLAGLTGIEPVRENRYIRPILFLSGESVRDICAERGYPFVTDSTNTDTAYSRNFIRHEILPKLRVLHPHPEEAVLRMTELLAKDNAYLEEEAEICLQRSQTVAGLSREMLRTLHPVLAARVLRKGFTAFAPSSAMTREQTDELLRLTLSAEKRIRQISLSGGITAVIGADTVTFVPTDRRQKTYESDSICAAEERIVPAMEPEDMVVMDWYGGKILLYRGNLPKLPENLENIYNLSIQQPIDFAKIKGVLCLRKRKPGDTIRYGGIHRKIRKLQNEYHMPPDQRDRMAILADAEEILWADGLGTCERVEISDETRDFLWICVCCKADRTL